MNGWVLIALALVWVAGRFLFSRDRSDSNLWIEAGVFLPVSLLVGFLILGVDPGPSREQLWGWFFGFFGLFL